MLRVACLLELRAFGDSPVHLGSDHARSSTAAASIGSSGRDLNGDVVQERISIDWDYFTDCRIRSACWFDPIDFRDVAECLIANASGSSAPAVYRSQDVDDVARRMEPGGKSTVVLRKQT